MNNNREAFYSYYKVLGGLKSNKNNFERKRTPGEIMRTGGVPPSTSCKNCKQCKKISSSKEKTDEKNIRRCKNKKS